MFTPGVSGTTRLPETAAPLGSVVEAVTVREVEVSLAGTVMNIVPPVGSVGSRVIWD
jgi:hypothetical protein